MVYFYYSQNIFSLQGERGDTGQKGEPGFIVSSPSFWKKKIKITCHKVYTLSPKILVRYLLNGYVAAYV